MWGSSEGGGEAGVLAEAWWLCVYLRACVCMCGRQLAGHNSCAPVPSALPRCKQQLMSVFIARCIEVHREL